MPPLFQYIPGQGLMWLSSVLVISQTDGHFASGGLLQLAPRISIEKYGNSPIWPHIFTSKQIKEDRGPIRVQPANYHNKNVGFLDICCGVIWNDFLPW